VCDGGRARRKPIFFESTGIYDELYIVIYYIHHERLSGF
jgi:hypothetical protein